MAYSWPVTLDEAKAQINAESTTNDGELLGYIDAATNLVENLVGTVTPGTSYTEVHDGGDVSIYLRHTPVQSVTSLTEVIGSVTYTLTLQPPGSSTSAYGFSIDDADNGKIVRRSAAGQPWRFTPGIGNVFVAYTAGRVSVPANVRLAALFLIEHMWEQTQRGDSSGRPTPGLDVGSDISYGPNRESQAMALLEPHRLAPKVA